MKKRRLALILAFAMTLNSFSTSAPMWHLHAAEAATETEQNSEQTAEENAVALMTGSAIGEGSDTETDAVPETEVTSETQEQDVTILEYTEGFSMVLPYGETEYCLKVSEPGLYYIWTDADYGMVENYIECNALVSTDHRVVLDAGDIVSFKTHMILENQNLYMDWY